MGSGKDPGSVCSSVSLRDTGGLLRRAAGGRCTLHKDIHLRVGGHWNPAHVLLAPQCGAAAPGESVPFSNFHNKDPKSLTKLNLLSLRRRDLL